MSESAGAPAAAPPSGASTTAPTVATATASPAASTAVPLPATTAAAVPPSGASVRSRGTNNIGVITPLCDDSDPFQVYGNGGAGIMLHRSSNDAVVNDNYSHDNGDAGLALFESSDCTVEDNVFENNKYGVRWSNGANSNTVSENIITMDSGKNTKYALYMYIGSDEQEAEGNVDGHPNNNLIYKNEIYSEQDEVWRMEGADDNNFKFNVFHSGLYGKFINSVDNRVHRNTYPDDWYFKTDDDSCFKTTQKPVC